MNIPAVILNFWRWYKNSSSLKYNSIGRYNTANILTKLTMGSLQFPRESQISSVFYELQIMFNLYNYCPVYNEWL